MKSTKVVFNVNIVTISCLFGRNQWMWNMQTTYTCHVYGWTSNVLVISRFEIE